MDEKEYKGIEDILQMGPVTNKWFPTKLRNMTSSSAQR